MPDRRLWSEKMINTSARAKQEPEANRSQAEDSESLSAHSRTGYLQQQRTVSTSRPIAIQAISSSSFLAAEEIRAMDN